jgi:hypothetical protein
MKRLALALALLVAVPAVADASCFFIFCTHPYYRHRAASSSQDAPRVSGFCKGIQDARIKSQGSISNDDFIIAFPSNQQDKVRECLQ